MTPDWLRAKDGDTPVVCIFAPLPYDHTRSRKHAFAEAAHAAGFDSVYVEPPNSHSRYAARGKTPSLARRGGMVESAEGPRILALPKKWAWGRARASLRRSRMEPFYARWLKDALQPLFSSGRPIWAIVTEAVWATRLRDMPFDVFIYDKTDEPQNLRRRLSVEDYRRLETEILRRSDLLIAPSEGLLDAGAALREDIPATLVPNGVNFDAFRARRFDPVPEFDGTAEPVVGFFGTLGAYVDIPLLERCARALPQQRFAVVGAAARDSMRDSLRGIPNVEVHDAVPYHRVASVMNRLSVCLIPFREGAVSTSANPVTFYEELCLGKPIVLTPMPELTAMQDLCYMTRSGFIDAITEALNESDRTLPERRVEAARQFDWQDLFGRIVREVTDVPRKAH